MLSCHLCLLISCYSLVFCLLSFDCSFCLAAWYIYIFFTYLLLFLIVICIIHINLMYIHNNELIVCLQIFYSLHNGYVL